MHASMFNHLPDPEKILNGCVVTFILALAAGVGIGWLIWG